MPPLPPPAPPTLIFTLGLINCCFWVQQCNAAGTRTPRLYYCGTPQDRNERWGGGTGRGVGDGGSVKNYSEQHRSRRLHTQDERQLSGAGQRRERKRPTASSQGMQGTSEPSFQRETEMETGAGGSHAGGLSGMWQSEGMEGRKEGHGVTLNQRRAAEAKES